MTTLGIPGGFPGFPGFPGGGGGGGGGGWEGMNVEQVQQLGRQLNDLASRVQDLTRKVDSEVNTLASNWHGDDSKRFEQEWSGNYRAVLLKAAHLLEEMSQKALQQAQQQQATSSS